eukprot:249964-Amphidinium_carterae.1
MMRKIQTTHNPADVLTKHLPAATTNSHLDRLCLQTGNNLSEQTVGTLHGLPTSKKMTIGMIGLTPQDDNEVQPAVTTATTASMSRRMRQTQLQQLRRRRRRTSDTPPRIVQPQREIVARDNLARANTGELVFAQRQMAITLPWSFFVSLLMRILLCIHYSHSGSTISPLATARQLVTMAGTTPIPTAGPTVGPESERGFAMVYEAQSGVTNGAMTMETDNPLQQPRMKARAPQPPQSTPRPSTSANPTSPIAEVSTGTAGQSGASTTPAAEPMETDNEAVDETMGAQSISSSSQASIATSVVMDVESLGNVGIDSHTTNWSGTIDEC